MRFHILLLALVLHQNFLLCKAFPPTYSGEPPAVGDSGGGDVKDTLTSSIKYVTMSSTRAAAAAAEASSSSSSSSLSTNSVYEAALPTQDDSTTATATNTAEHDGESSKKIIGSSVVTSVSVILNGNEPQFMDAIGVKVPKPLPSLQVASPINLLNPDRYEFYTFDDNGELVKRLMTLQEIQSIVANGDGEGPSIIHSAPILERDPEKNVQDIVMSVQNVLNKQVESTNNSTVNAVPTLDTPDVSSSWSMILPAIFGNTGGDIFPPQKPPQHINMTPDTDLLETSTKQTTPTTKRPKPPKRKPGQKRKTTTTTSTTELPQTPQIVQEELAPHESVYTGIEQYQNIASNIHDFDAFSTINMQPIYHKIPAAEVETTTRRVFLNNQEVIQTPATITTAKPGDELPEESGKKPTNAHPHNKHGPPHRRRPGASSNKQKIKKKPQAVTTTKPPIILPITTSTAVSTTTTATTAAPITIPPVPTTLAPELVTLIPTPISIAPPKKKKKPTRQPIPHYSIGVSNKPHLGSQKRKPHPQTTPHHRPRPSVQQQHQQQQDQQPQKHHHPTQQKEHQQQDQQQHHPTQQPQYPTTLPVLQPQLPQPQLPLPQLPQLPIPQEQHPQQQIHKHPAHDSVVDATEQEYQHVNHHKHRPRPTKISTTTTKPTTTATHTIPTAPILAVTTTPLPIDASLVIATHSGLVTSSAIAPNPLLPTYAPLPAYPVPIFDFSQAHQPPTPLASGSEETETEASYLKINPLLSLSMIQQQHQQQQQQEQLPSNMHSDEDLNTKLSFDQIMLSLKQDESKDVEKTKEEVKVTQVQELETLPVKYDSAETTQTLEDMVNKLKKPVPTNSPPTVSTTLTPLVTQNAESSNVSTVPTTASPTTVDKYSDADSTEVGEITNVASVDELKPAVELISTPQNLSETVAYVVKTEIREEERMPIIKDTANLQLEQTTEQPETATILPQVNTNSPQITTKTPEITTLKMEVVTTKPVQLTTTLPPTTTISDFLLELETTTLLSETLLTETNEQPEKQQATNSASENNQSLEQKPAKEQSQDVLHYEPLYVEQHEPILTQLTTTEIPETQTSNYETEDSDSSTVEPATKTDFSIEVQDTTMELTDIETVPATTSENLRLPVYVNIPHKVETLIAEGESIQTEQPQVIDLAQHLNQNMVQPTEKITMTEFQTQAATVASMLVGGTSTNASEVAMNSNETKDELELLMSDVIQQITNDEQTYKLPPEEENSNRLSNFAQFNTSFLLKQSSSEEVVHEEPQSNEDAAVEMVQATPNNTEIGSDMSVKSTSTAEQFVGSAPSSSKEDLIKQEDKAMVESTTVTMPTNKGVEIQDDTVTTTKSGTESEHQKEAVDVGDQKETLNVTPTPTTKAPMELVAANASTEYFENDPAYQMETAEPTKAVNEAENLEEVNTEVNMPDANQLIKIVNIDNNLEKGVKKPQETAVLKFSTLESSADNTTPVKFSPIVNTGIEETAEKITENLSDTSTENIAVISDESATTETSEESSSSVSEDKISSATNSEQLKSEESKEGNQSTTGEDKEDKEDAITNATQPHPQYTVIDEKKEEENATTSPPETDVESKPTEDETVTNEPTEEQNESDISANVELVASSQQLELDSVEESTEIPTKLAANPALSDSSVSDELTTERNEDQSATETSTEDEIATTTIDVDQLPEAIEEDPYIKLGELTAKPTVVKAVEKPTLEAELSTSISPSKEAEEEQTTFEHMENNYEEIVNGHQGMSPAMQNYDPTKEQDEEDEEDQGGFEETTKSSQVTTAVPTTTTQSTSSSTPKLTTLTATTTTTTTQQPLIVSTTTKPTTTTTTKRLNTLKPVSYYKQPIFSAYNQPEPPKLPTYGNISPLISMQRPPALSNLMHTSSLATRPPVKLEPSPGHSKGLEASVANLDEDLLEFGKLCNELAFSYWKSITSEKISSARSLIISPFALTSMLSMVFLGARGGTSGEMNEVLRLDDMVTFNPHLVFKNITESVEKATDSDIATAAFVREIFSDRSNGKILQFFKEKTQQLYAGHVEEVNFHVVNDIIRRRTNLLIKRHTMGKVLEYLRTNSVWVNGPLATISANLFQTDCKHGSTHDRDGEMFFQVHPTLRQRRLVPIPAVLYKSGFTAGYEPKLDATIVAFGRIEDTVSTIYIMPGHQSSVSPIDNLDRLERELVEMAFSGNAWSNVLTSVMDRPGMEVQLPRFSHRSFVNASLGLQKMGLKGLFKSDFADLRGLTGSSNRDIYLSDMIQINTFSTCGEEKISDHHHVEMYPAPPLRKRNKDVDANDEDDFDSSEAIIDFGSLVQESALGRGFYDDLLDPKFLELPLPLRPRQARVPDTPRLRFDKPFLYFVRHNPTGMILFMGRFNPRLLP